MLRNKHQDPLKNADLANHAYAQDQPAIPSLAGLSLKFFAFIIILELVYQSLLSSCK